MKGRTALTRLLSIVEKNAPEATRLWITYETVEKVLTVHFRYFRT